MKEYYSRLYLKDKASLTEVKKAYRKLAKKFHPDKNIKDEDFSDEFKLIHEAYTKLVNHLSSSKENKKRSNETYYNTSSSTNETDIVVSNSKYAEAIEESNDVFFNILISGLTILFVLCIIYAIIDKLF